MSGKRTKPLHRWSERKAKARRESEPAGETEAVEEAVAPAESEETVPAAGAEQLPDIDGLDRDSDYSIFMGDGVPEHLKRLALRKLWLSDPVLANVDGLVDYGEDFTASELMGDAVKTIYRVGKGLVDEAEEPADIEDEEQEDGGGDGEVEVAESTTEATDEPAENG